MIQPFIFYLFRQTVIGKEDIALLPVLGTQKLKLTEAYLTCIEITIST